MAESVTKLDSDTVDLVSIGHHFRVWWFVLPAVLGALSLIVSPLANTLVDGSSIFVLGLAGVFLAWTIAAAILIVRGRRYLQIHPDGFCIIDSRGRRELEDEQITDIALSHRWRHAGGKPIAEVRKLVLWIGSDWRQEQIRMEQRLPTTSSDPLSAFIDRICSHALERAEFVLANRGTIHGSGWSLDRNELHLTDPSATRTIPLKSLSAVEQIGSSIRIWQAGEPRAIASLPHQGKNTWILEPLLSTRTHAHHTPVPAVRGGTRGGLGRVLFERRSGPAGVLVCAILGTALGLLAATLLWVGLSTQDWICAGIGMVIALLSGTCLAAGLRLRKTVLRCHEHGLERVTMTGVRKLPFDDVEVFSFERRRNFSHGRYTGTTYTLVFADRSRELGEGIFYSTTVRNSDEELEVLRDHAAAHIARRMARTFARHADVQWTPELWFRGSVIEYSRKRRWFATRRPLLVPLASVMTYEVRDNWFHIWTDYQERAVVSVKTSSPNFFAGLLLFQGLLRTQAHTESARQRARELTQPA